MGSALITSMHEYQSPTSPGVLYYNHLLITGLACRGTETGTQASTLVTKLVYYNSQDEK